MGCEVLRSFSCFSGCRAEIVDHGGIEPLMAALDRFGGEVPVLRQLCASALANLNYRDNPTRSLCDGACQR